MKADVVVVGGGIAGLSAAWSLSRAGGRRVVLLEREEVFASHASGRNAAIFRHLDASPGGVELALRSGALLDALLGSRAAWLRPTGGLFAARTAAPLQRLADLGREHGIRHAAIDGPGLARRAPALRGGCLAEGLEVPDDGVMDIHAVCTALADAARSAGAVLRLRAAVASLRAASGALEAVELTTGERIPTEQVVIASGAWSQALGATAGAPLALRPLRRHIAQLDERPSLPTDGPVVWCVDDEAYFRPEPGGALASPCDEDPCEPGLPPEAPHARELLAEKLARIAPALAESGVRRGWACLRTFAADRAIVLGPDPRVRGLSWMAGLGGHGMTAGVACGELLAGALGGERSALIDALSPKRLL